MFINNYIFYIIYLFLLNYINSFELKVHPLENKCAYISGINDIRRINSYTLNDLKHIFKQYPLLIFKNDKNISPNEFLNFLTHFDADYDEFAIKKPNLVPEQILQPFDQFPDCPHVAPRGNYNIDNLYGIKNISVYPSEGFMNNYLWHTDILGHPYKRPNLITGFYILEQPLIGGDTDFISGEKIYENLSLEQREACKNMLVEINRKKIQDFKYKTDHSGIVRTEQFEETIYKHENVIIPLVYSPDFDNLLEKERILIMPTFIENVYGWSVIESRLWLKKFMLNHVLPHRFSIQWKKGDIAVFNNRRFIHSSTPAINYLDYCSQNRLLFQSFLPTKKPLYGVAPNENNINYQITHNIGWINNKITSIISTDSTLKYINSKKHINNNYYLLA
jgi:alpha-ketoglutarate-dependent taurine dioxygenase